MRGKPTQWQPPELDDALADDLYSKEMISDIVCEYLVKVGSEERRASQARKVEGVLKVLRLGLLQREKPRARDIEAALSCIDKQVTAALNAIQELDRFSLRELKHAAGRDRRAPTPSRAIIHRVGKYHVVERPDEERLSDALKHMRAVRRWARRAKLESVSAKRQVGRPERTVERHAVEQLLHLWSQTIRNRIQPAIGASAAAEFPNFLAFVHAALQPMLEAYGTYPAIPGIAREIWNAAQM